MSYQISIPLSISADASGMESVALTSTEESIDSLIDLVVFTPRGSYCADPEFGFDYWNHEFSNIDVREFNNSYMGMMTGTDSVNQVNRHELEAGLRESIKAYEPRLLSPEVKIELEANERVSRANTQSKYEMKIHVSGAIDDGLGVTRKYEKRIAFMVEPVKKFNR